MMVQTIFDSFRVNQGFPTFLGYAEKVRLKIEHWHITKPIKKKTSTKFMH